MLECQWTGPKRIPKTLLVPLLVVKVSFEKVGMDLVGPLENSVPGSSTFWLDYATWYPEAIPLLLITAANIATKLMKVFL